MPEPMTSERLQEIRHGRIPHGSEAIWILLHDRDELLAEVDRLKADRDRLAERLEIAETAMRCALRDGDPEESRDALTRYLEAVER